MIVSCVKKRKTLVSRIIAAVIWMAVTGGVVLVSACTTAGLSEKGAPLAIGGKLKITKFVKTWIPLGSTANDLTPFIVMAALLTAAAVLMWRLPKRQWARRTVQTISAVAFVVGIHPCGCMTRDLVLGLTDLSVNDLAAFKYMIVFATVGAFTAVVGRSFCGWVCPLGYAQELIAKVSRRFDSSVGGGRYLRALRGAVLFFAAGAVLYWLLIGPLNFAFARVYGSVFLATAVIILLGTRLRSVLLVKYLFGVEILLAIVYAFYRTKPGTYSVIDYTMVFFVVGLTLIVLTILGDEQRDRFFKKFRYALWLGILSLYIYQVYKVGPMCLFFQGSAEWPVLLSFGGVFLLSILLQMSWCRYMCPEGAALGLLAAKSAWQINRNDRCTGCGTCTKVCPMRCVDYGIRDRKVCLYCAKCMDHCPEGALEFVNEIGVQGQTIPYPPPEEYVPQEAVHPEAT